MLATGKRFLNNNLRPETLARLASPINVLLILALAYTLAQLSWSLVPLPLAAPTIIREPSGPSAAMTDAPEKDYSIIANWRLFGKVESVRPAPPPVVTAPETKLNLRLAGIFYTEEGGNALALIAEGSGEERSYAVGAQLPGGVRLQQILRDRVVLSRNGQLETLSLPRESEGISTIPSSSPATPSPSSAEPTTNEVHIDASAIASRFREAISTQPEDLQDLALVDPYIQNGQFTGFRLRPGRDRRLLQQLGLRSGDIITEINGARLTDPATSFALLQEIVNADQVTVRVLRNGNEIPFTFYTHAQ